MRGEGQGRDVDGDLFPANVGEKRGRGGNKRLVDVAHRDREAGRKMKKGDVAVVVESVKAASDVYAPADGEIIEANTALSAEPALVNSAPSGDGWLWKMKLADESQLSGLLDEAGYNAHIA